MLILGLVGLICLFTNHQTASLVISIVLAIFYLQGLITRQLKGAFNEIIVIIVTLVITFIITKDFTFSFSFAVPIGTFSIIILAPLGL